MGLGAQLTAFQYVGTTGSSSVHVSLTSDEAMKSASKRPGSTVNIRTIRKSDEGLRAIILDPRLTFPGFVNRRTAWTSQNGIQKFSETPMPNDGYAIGWDSKLDAAHLQSNVLGIGSNDGFSFRAFIYKPDTELPVWTARWDRWQFQIKNGKAFVMKQATGWSQSLEDAYNLLLAIEEPTPEEIETIDTTASTLYEVKESLSLEPGGDGWYGTAFTLTFLAEPRGAVTIFLGEGARWQEETIEVPAVLATRQPGTIWSSGPLNILSSTGAWFIEAGYPLFGPVGKLKDGPYLHPVTVDWQAAETSVLADKSSDTDVQVVILDEPYNDTHENSTIVVELTTTDPRKTPYLYAADVLIEPLPLPVPGGEAVFNSADVTLDTGPIIDIQPQLEGDMRRSQATVLMRDVDGRTFAPLGNRYEALENRNVQIKVAGTTTLSRGIAKTVQLANMAKVEENLLRSAVTRPDTQITLNVCDLWCILEETLLYERAIIGDGLKLGALIRRALKFAGMTDSQLADVSATDGYTLPTAAFGEDYAHASSDGQSVADYLREKIDRYGMGWILWQKSDSEGWKFAKRNTTIVQIGGHNAAFVSGGGRSATTYPGRFAILSPLDHLREFDDFYNYFIVVGATGANGKRIIHHEAVWESITSPGLVQARNFIGRIKQYPVVIDENIRTQSEAIWVGRSLKERYSQPGRYYSFETYYHIGLFPGDRVTVDAIPCCVKRLAGSIKQDRMQLTVQEVL
jgi:hypothetical protein